MKSNYDVAAYIWPSYTGNEPRTLMFWPDGNGEWERVQKAKPKFPGHTFPRKPVWGYVNEADRYVMEMQIDAAADHGVNVFAYDWYWYDGRPFLENCLNDGYLKARNNDRVKFYIMWANHDATYLWDVRNADKSDAIIWRGAVDRKEFEIVGKRLIEKYFTHPSYYKIDGKPVFMIYRFNSLLEGLGSIENVKSAFDWLRNECVKAGLAGLHLQYHPSKIYGKHVTGVAPTAEKLIEENKRIKPIGFDSASYYNLACNPLDQDYKEIVLPETPMNWEMAKEAFDIPVFPNVALGWDKNQRFQERYSTTINNTPENVETLFRKAKEYIDKSGYKTKLVTIYSWNEWTEGAYLQPDSVNGYGYLEAVKKVFLEEKEVSAEN